MIESPPTKEQLIRRDHRPLDRDAGWRPANEAASANCAERLASDLEQILLFADREFERQRRAEGQAAPALELTGQAAAAVRRHHAAPELPLAWLGKALRSGPWFASQLLGALIAVEMARASMMLVGTGPLNAPPPAVAINARPLERPLVDVHGIVAAHLFGDLAADPSTQDPSGAPRTTAHLLLAGILATENPKTGLAIISDAGPARIYSVGSSVGGASLYSVYRDRVILSRDGVFESLVLPRLSPGQGRPPGQATAGTASGTAGSAASQGEILSTLAAK